MLTLPRRALTLLLRMLTLPRRILTLPRRMRTLLRRMLTLLRRALTRDPGFRRPGGWLVEPTRMARGSHASGLSKPP